jgi:predicted AAA+ superfamily ATPase
LESNDVFTLAPEIAAVSDVHRLLMSSDCVSEEEALELLKIKKPLERLAGEWELDVIRHSRDIGDFITELVENGMEDDLPANMVNELRVKYGEYLPLETICLLELVEISRRIFGSDDENDFDTDFNIFKYEDDEDGQGADV